MASRSLNRVLLIGNLTRDPELKYTPTGTAVCSFGIATNRSWKTTDGSTKEEVQYHRIVAWQKLAELCGKLLTKGRKVYLEGRLVYRTFTGRDNIQRTVSEIVLDDFIVFGDGRKMPTEGEATVSDVKVSGAGEQMEEASEETNNQSEKKDDEAKAESKKSEEVNPDDIPF